MPNYYHTPWCTCFWCSGAGEKYCYLSSSSTSQADEALTYKTTCRWCEKEVFYHTNKYGDFILFDSLVSPWEVHGCWEELREQQKSVQLLKLKDEQSKHLVLAGAIWRRKTTGCSPTEEGVAIEMGISVEYLRQHYKSLYVIISEMYGLIVLVKGSKGDLGDVIEPDMIAIPSGSFQMGSNDNYHFEKPVHSVNVKSFYLGKYPITQEQYQSVMVTNLSKFMEAKRPVECISWFDAMEFCYRLSQETGRKYRLPSEAEWEYACRAGTQTKYCFGDDGSKLEEYAWYSRNYNGETHPVGQKKPNQFGLYDMQGNVAEWCSDIFHENYNDAPTDGSSWETPTEENFLALRGGSYASDVFRCRSATRSIIGLLADYRCSSVGFRVALALD